MTSDFAIRAAEVSDMAACAVIKNAWVDETDWMVHVHPADRLELHYRERILPVSTFVVAEREGEVAGFLAVENDGDVDSLYVTTGARSLGIGRALLDAARAVHPDGLKLWTFQANQGAQRFYLREGFREHTRTEGENEEGLPDVLYFWEGAMTRGAFFPVLTVVAGIVLIWYVAAIFLNAPWARDQAERAGQELGAVELVQATWSQERPSSPAPHQVTAELWKTTVTVAPTSKRSLLRHAGITLSATLLGFVLGAAFGILLAIGIVHNRAMDGSVMPWVITSQTIPILAIAPMIIVVLNSIGISGLLPKAMISMYLSFFPVVVGMVKGLRSPDAMLLDQMRTWNASARQTLIKLRWPAAMPYLFASLKVAVAASLVGAIIGELPTGAVAGLGARMLSGSYYGQTVQIWSALVMAAALAAALVGAIGLIERGAARAMGAKS